MIDTLLAALISVAKSLFSWTGTKLNVHPMDVWAIATTAPTKVAVSETSTQSAALTATRCLIWCDVDTWYTAGTNPTAVIESGDFLPAWGEREVFITSGHKIATFRGNEATVDGSLWIRGLE